MSWHRAGRTRPRLLLVLALIVLLPVTTMVLLGIRVTRDERLRRERRTDQLLSLRLQDVESTIVRLTAALETELLPLLDWLDGPLTGGELSEDSPGVDSPGVDSPALQPAAVAPQAAVQTAAPTIAQATKRPAVSPLDRDRLRAAGRESRLARQLYALDSDGSMIYPIAPLTETEALSLERTQTVWATGSLVNHTQGVEGEERPLSTTGWYTWFWGEGTHSLFWLQTGGGGLSAVEVSRSALIDQVLSALPETPAQPDQNALGTRITLTDVRDRTLYQWGHYDPPPGEEPRADHVLAPPFDSWSLQVYADSVEGLPVSTLINVAGALLAVILSVLALAIVLFREGSRELREATQKVSFVGQVSHELKTPLTNIRLYAELLAGRWSEADQRTMQQLEVITSESQRLSRLIQNVLTFTRGSRPEELPQRVDGVVDQIVEDVLETFGPALRESGFQVTSKLNTPDLVLLDRDGLEQILGNLLSNALKYASSGGYLLVETGLRADTTTIRVVDRGPGIPKDESSRIFRPFERLGGDLTEGVSGAGIGLTIARDLARRSGGDLTLEAPAAGHSSDGAAFRLTLETPAAGGE